MRARNAYVVARVGAPRRDARPPGAAVARKLRAEIHPRDWIPGDLETGPPSTWRIRFRRGAGEVALVVAPADEQGDAWAVQIAPARPPGPLARALGRTGSATPADCFEIARAAHAVLAADARFTGVRWRWDALPDDESSTREPTAPMEQARRRRRRRRAGA